MAALISFRYSGLGHGEDPKHGVTPRVLTAGSYPRRVGKTSGSRAKIISTVRRVVVKTQSEISMEPLEGGWYSCDVPSALLNKLSA